MNVYFDENFWGCKREQPGKIPGKKICIEKEFTWVGKLWRIPAVYVCEEGLVVDFCIRIPAEEIGNGNLFCLDADIKLWADGEEMEPELGCGVFFIPSSLLQEEARSGEDAAELLMEAYGCDYREGWKFQRKSFAWTEGGKRPVHSLTVQLKKEPAYYPGPHFRTSLEDEKKCVEFIHPVTQAKHILTVQSLEQTVLPEQDFSGMQSGRLRILKAPANLLAMLYTVEPELSIKELQIYDCAESDPPVVERKTGAAGISVIGGADGPTSIFFAGKARSGKEQKNWKSVCSSLHYEPVEAVEWRMEFRVESEEQMEIAISI